MAMNCMKCGRETENDQVFCQDCLQIMKKYPVRPGTVVLLPRRRETIIKKTVKRHSIPLEEQVKILRKRLMIMWFVFVLCIALMLLMINPTLHYALDKHVEIGQNYSTVTANTSASPSNPE